MKSSNSANLNSVISQQGSFVPGPKLSNLLLQYDQCNIFAIVQFLAQVVCHSLNSNSAISNYQVIYIFGQLDCPIRGLLNKSYHHLPPPIWVEMDPASISPSPPLYATLLQSSSPWKCIQQVFLSVSLCLCLIAEQQLLLASFGLVLFFETTHMPTEFQPFLDPSSKTIG